MKISESLSKILDKPIATVADRKTSKLDKLISGLAIAAFMILSLGLYGIYIYKKLPVIQEKLNKRDLIQQQAEAVVSRHFNGMISSFGKFLERNLANPILKAIS